MNNGPLWFKRFRSIFGNKGLLGYLQTPLESDYLRTLIATVKELKTAFNMAGKTIRR
jgi:hypothetical protein